MFCGDCDGVEVDTYQQWIEHLQSQDHQFTLQSTVWSWSKEINDRSIVVTLRPNVFGEYGELPTTVSDVAWYFSNFGVVSNAYFDPNQKFCIVQLDERKSALTSLQNEPCVIETVPVILRLKGNLSPDDWFGLSSCARSHEVETMSTDMFQEKHNWLSSQIQNLDYEAQLDKFITLLTMSEYDFNKREQVRCELLSTIGQECGNAKIIGTADVVTGLGDSESLLNLCVENMDSIYSENTTENIYRLLLSTNGIFKGVSFGILQQLPSITAVHCSTGVNMQLCTNAFLRVQSSKLIQFMISLDPRVLPLMLIVRYWASYNIQPPNSMDNYVLELLVVVFLNTRKILPNVAFLQSKIPAVISPINNFWNASFCSDHQSISGILTYSGRAPVEYNQVTGKPTTSSILKLAKGFFQMYAEVDFGQSAVCTLLGYFLAKSDLDVDNPNARLPHLLQSYINWSLLQKMEDRMKMDSPMCVQDPFFLGLNVAADVSESSLIAFQNACHNSIAVLNGLERGTRSFVLNYNFLEFFTTKADNISDIFVENCERTEIIARPGVKRSSLLKPGYMYGNENLIEIPERKIPWSSTSVKANNQNPIAIGGKNYVYNPNYASVNYSQSRIKEPPGKVSRTFGSSSFQETSRIPSLQSLTFPPHSSLPIPGSSTSYRNAQGQPKSGWSPSTRTSWLNSGVELVSRYSQPYEEEDYVDLKFGRPQENDRQISKGQRGTQQPQELKNRKTRKLQRKEKKKEVKQNKAVLVTVPKKKKNPKNGSSLGGIKQQIPVSKESSLQVSNQSAELKIGEENSLKKKKNRKGKTPPDGVETFELRVNQMIKADFSHCFNFMFSSVATKEEIDQKCTDLWISFFKEFFTQVWTTSFNLSVQPNDPSDILGKLYTERPNTNSRSSYTTKQIRRLEKHLEKKLGGVLTDKLVQECAPVGDIEDDEDYEGSALNALKKLPQCTEAGNPYKTKFDQIPNQCGEWSMSFVVNGCFDAFGQRFGFGLLHKTKKGKPFAGLPPLEGYGKFYECIFEGLKPTSRTGVNKKFIVTAKVDTTKTPMEILTIFTETPDCQGMNSVFFSFFPVLRSILCQYVCYRLENWLKLQ